MSVRRNRAQCPGCLSAHRNAGLYCGACEFGLVVIETVKASLIVLAAAVAVFVAWWLS